MSNPSIVVTPIPEESTGYPCTLQVIDKPIPEISDDEVLLDMQKVGICGSDVHYWTHGRIGDFIVENEMILGHEAAAKVIKIGSKVTNLKVGDRVAIEPGYPLENDNFSKTGRYNLSPVFFCATPPDDGCLSRFYKHKAAFCYKLPDNLSYEEGALIEPLSVGIHACKRGDVSLGKNVLIMGAGTIGLVNLLVAKAMGAAKIVVVDVNQDRLKMAEEMGAFATISPKRENSAKETSEIIKKAFDNSGKVMPDVTIECTGVEICIQIAVYSTVSGGCAIMVGMGKDIVNFPILDACCREVDIRGIFRYCNTWPTAINMLSSGAVDVKKLVTSRVKLTDARKGFDMTRTGQGVKTMIDCSEEGNK